MEAGCYAAFEDSLRRVGAKADEWTVLVFRVMTTVHCRRRGDSFKLMYSALVHCVQVERTPARASKKQSSASECRNDSAEPCSLRVDVRKDFECICS